MEEKNKLLVIAKDIVFNENEKTSERLSGIKVLIEECVLSIRQKEIGLKRLYSFEKQLIEKLITEYKEKNIVEFMQKYGETKELNPEMINKMKKIDKPNHCYRVEGIAVIENDCNFCKKRICEEAYEEKIKENGLKLFKKD